jgi:dephospho-CoA kinase
MHIIGVTGTNGSGKGTLVRILEEHGYTHYSARDFLYEEIRKRGLPEDRDTLRMIGNTLRRERGPAYVIEELLRRAEQEPGISIVESIRCPKEAELLLACGGVLLAVDDPVEVRYERIQKRKHSTDFVTLSEFIEQERLESVGTEEWDMNIPRCVSLATYTFKDNGDSLQFKRKVDQWLKQML